MLTAIKFAHDLRYTQENTVSFCLSILQRGLHRLKYSYTISVTSFCFLN